jgi:hypothetical protein
MKIIILITLFSSLLVGCGGSDSKSTTKVEEVPTIQPPIEQGYVFSVPDITGRALLENDISNASVTISTLAGVEIDTTSTDATGSFLFKGSNLAKKLENETRLVFSTSGGSISNGDIDSSITGKLYTIVSIDEIQNRSKVILNSATTFITEMSKSQQYSDKSISFIMKNFDFNDFNMDGYVNFQDINDEFISPTSGYFNTKIKPEFISIIKSGSDINTELLKLTSEKGNVLIVENQQGSGSIELSLIPLLNDITVNLYGEYADSSTNNIFLSAGESFEFSTCNINLECNEPIEVYANNKSYTLEYKKGVGFDHYWDEYYKLKDRLDTLKRPSN